MFSQPYQTPQNTQKQPKTVPQIPKTSDGKSAKKAGWRAGIGCGIPMAAICLIFVFALINSGTDKGKLPSDTDKDKLPYDTRIVEGDTVYFDLPTSTSSIPPASSIPPVSSAHPTWCARGKGTVYFSGLNAFMESDYLDTEASIRVNFDFEMLWIYVTGSWVDNRGVTHRIETGKLDVQQVRDPLPGWEVRHKQSDPIFYPETTTGPTEIDFWVHEKGITSVMNVYQAKSIFNLLGPRVVCD